MMAFPSEAPVKHLAPFIKFSIFGCLGNYLTETGSK